MSRRFTLMPAQRQVAGRYNPFSLGSPQRVDDVRGTRTRDEATSGANNKRRAPVKSELASTSSSSPSPPCAAFTNLSSAGERAGYAPAATRTTRTPSANSTTPNQLIT
eukprot:1178821-Prorocentrum_minimum.AAC.1